MPRRTAIARPSARGAAGVEWIVVCLLVAVTGIAGFHSLSAETTCRMKGAIASFAGGAAPSCGGNGSGGCSGGSCAPGSNNCFVAGTPVLTDAGLQPIERIAPGARVWSRGEDGVEGWRPVVHSYRHPSTSRLRLLLRDDGDDDDGHGAVETLETTPGHRLRAVGRGWVEARALVPGVDAIERRDGPPLPLVAVSAVAGEALVYNLEVDELHSYFVGTRGAWAHNMCGPSGADDDDDDGSGDGQPDDHAPPGWPTSPGQAQQQYRNGQRWSNGEIRQYYNDLVGSIATDLPKWQQDGMSLEDQAKAAYDIRHNARLTTRQMMSSQMQLWGLQWRDYWKYGQGDGPTFDQLVQKELAKGLTLDQAYQAIIGSSGRTNEGFNNWNGATPTAPPPNINGDGPG